MRAHHTLTTEKFSYTIWRACRPVCAPESLGSVSIRYLTQFLWCRRSATGAAAVIPGDSYSDGDQVVSSLHTSLRASKSQPFSLVIAEPAKFQVAKFAGIGEVLLNVGGGASL